MKPLTGKVAVVAGATRGAGRGIAVELGAGEQERVHKIRKVLTQDASKVAFRTSYVREDTVPKLLQADLRPPLHHVLETVFGLSAVEAEEKIEYIAADAFRASMLEVGEHHPLILIVRIVYAASGEPIECARTYYRADEFRFSRRLQRAGWPSSVHAIAT